MNPADLLRERRLKVTGPRLAVLEVVRRIPHATADTVLREVRRDHMTISVQAVYDVLHALTDAGIVRRIEPAGHPARYEGRVADNHHHVVCRSCGALDDVDCAVGHAPCLVPSTTSGFHVDTAEVTYWGLCPACQTDSAPDLRRPAGSTVLPHHREDLPS